MAERSAFRADIEGLRAVAVLAVLGFHAAVPGLAGGYVGVDVFFVMSGFLITGQVLGRSEFSLAEFYARRARRILPAACVVLLSTALATWLLLPPLRQQDVAYDLLTAALNGGNWRFVADQTNYLAASRAPSPLLHYWSLGVEEQFYLVWAPLVLLAILAAKRWQRSIRGLVLGEILVLSAASLALSLHWTNTSAPLAYMGSPSRAWQFGAGAILAVLLSGRSLGIGRIRAVAGFVGAVLIAGAVVAFDSHTRYPGTAALIPVAGTVLVLFAGSGEYPGFAISGLLARRAPRAIGRLSFALYLWHWPILVLAEARFGNVAWPLAATLAALAVLPAYLTMRLVERPLRFSELVASTPRRGLAIGATAVMLPLAAGLAVGSGAARTLGDVRPFDLATLPAASADGPHLLAAPVASRTGGATMPSPAQARKDFPPDGACEVAPAEVISPLCMFAPPIAATVGTSPASNAGPASLGSATGLLPSAAPPIGLVPSAAPPTADRIVLLGDSHAGQWFSAVSRVAAAHHLAVEELVKQGCPLADLTVASPVLGRAYHECDAWRAATVDRLAHEPRPALIVVSELDWYAPATVTQPAVDRTLTKLAALGAPIAALHDTPKPPADIPVCVSGAERRWADCAFPHDQAVAPDPLAQDPRVTDVDLTPTLCPDTSCPAVLDGVLLYRDDSHLTDAAAYLLAPRLDARLPLGQAWHTLFRADFTGPAGPLTGPDWIIDTGHCYPGCAAPDWGTGEVESMSAGNVRLDGRGDLAITPLRSADGTWTSGRVETKRADFAAPPDGVLRIESRLALPAVDPRNGLGYWPAFWALGSGVRDGSQPWPQGGELDVLEGLDGRPGIWSTFHCGAPHAGPCREPAGIGSGAVPCEGCAGTFHTYAIEVDRRRQQIRWYVDAAEVFHVDRGQVDPDAWDQAVDHGFAPIFDLAIGGRFPAALDGPPAADPGPGTVSGRPMLISSLEVSTRSG